MGQRVRRRYVKENTWRCSSCHHENLGRHTDCQNCHSPKETEETYNPVKPGSAEITSPELLKLARAGANRTCLYCGADIRKLNDICTNCAATRHEHREEIGADATESDFRNSTVSAPDLTESIGSNRRNDGDGNDSLPPIHRFNWPNLRTVLIVLGGLVTMGGLIWLCVWLFVPYEVDVTVTTVHWQIDRALRQKTLRHDSGWRSDMPAATFNESCETRQNGTENCNPHDCNCHEVNYDCDPHDCNCHEVNYDCDPHDCNCHEVCHDNSNGFSDCSEVCDTCYNTCSRRECDTCYNTCSRRECDTCYDQCPVYEEWCSYNFYEWPVVDQASTSGSDLNVSPPTLTAHGLDQRLDQSERYEVNFDDGSNTWTHRPENLSDFSRFPPTTRWRIKTNRTGRVWPLHPLN
ncbi:hypothetical protein KKE28_01515 [Patescibacteria group bacterium]|nr:hypothetical protein [Patescibacteria group bacterium]